ncbi:MAG: DUF2059 domain-containing protein [Idiomarina sp.]|nr:DUF2059 domain-containing protein [Idiomarina sp.]
MMKLFLFLFALCAFSVSAESEVYDLLEVNGAKAYFSNHQGLMTELMISQRPELAQQREVVEAWEEKYFAWSKLRENLAPIYTDRFSEQEIAELINFFEEGGPEEFMETPTGEKLQAYSAEINAEFTSFGYRYMEEVGPRLDEMLEQDDVQ